MSETLAEIPSVPVRDMLAAVATRHRRVFVRGLPIVPPATVSIYVLNYVTTCVVATLHLPASVALVAP